MKINAKNGVYLGEVEKHKEYLMFIPRGNMTLYMLEEATRIMKELKRILK